MTINYLTSYEVKIEKSEKAGSHLESNPGHLWLEPLVLCHWAGQPPTLTILYICTIWLPVTAGLFTFLYFRLITSYFQHETRYSEHLEWEKPLNMGSFLMEKIFRSIPKGVLTAHAEWLPDVTEAFSTTRSFLFCLIIFYFQCEARYSEQSHNSKNRKC